MASDHTWVVTPGTSFTQINNEPRHWVTQRSRSNLTVGKLGQKGRCGHLGSAFWPLA